ncbi:MAG TPA: S8 family serine peptidase [Patescibacteria group bacterium]|nr:S8 family serine peptidase [Patescibacteria group bacterium]
MVLIRTRRLHPLLAAVLATLTATSAALAAEPAPTSEAGAQPSGAEERVIVLLEPDANVTAEASAARSAGIEVGRTYTNAVDAFTATVSPAEERRLAADPQVVAIVPDQKIAEPLSGQAVPTGVSRVFGRQSPTVSASGLDGRVDADVAIFDTGIDPTHTDLVVAGGFNCASSNRSNWVDEHGHGTHVAGTVGARDDGVGVVGVAPGVRLWAVRILDAKGEGFLSWWLCGLDWIAAQNDPADPSRPLIEAVNMSVTRWGRDDGSCGTASNDPFHQAICRVVARGITVVAAAANDSGSAARRTPAAYDEVITVSALADTDGLAGGAGGNLCWSWGGFDVDDTFADFSNFGPDVDLIAPGKCIRSTRRGQAYGFSSGTSMAAPHVTGAVALYKATRPHAPPSEVRWALQYLGNRDWDVSTDPDGQPDILLDVSRIVPLGDFAPTATLPVEGLVAGEAGTAWTLPLTVGRGPGFIEPVAFEIVAPPPLTAAITGPASLSGTDEASGLVVTVPPSTPAGVYEVVVRAAYHATRVHEIRVPVSVENAPPVAVAPVVSFIRGSRTSLTDLRVRVDWPAAADQSPIVGYELGEVGEAGPAGVAATAGTVRSAARTIPFATPRVYAVRATDGPGNLGEWAAAAAVEVSLVDDSSAEVRRSAGWTARASAHSLGGRTLFATRARASLRYTFTGRAIALVGPRSSTRGRAEIWLNGRRVATISQHARTSGSRVVLYEATLDPLVPHTIEVRVLGTAGHPRFDVDAFLVLR